MDKIDFSTTLHEVDWQEYDQIDIDMAREVAFVIERFNHFTERTRHIHGSEGPCDIATDESAREYLDQYLNHQRRLKESYIYIRGTHPDFPDTTFFSRVKKRGFVEEPKMPMPEMVKVRKCTPVQAVWKFNGTKDEGWYPSTKEPIIEGLTPITTWEK